MICILKVIHYYWQMILKTLHVFPAPRLASQGELDLLIDIDSC